jgi:hypothetical protein
MRRTPISNKQQKGTSLWDISFRNAFGLFGLKAKTVLVVYAPMADDCFGSDSGTTQHVWWPVVWRRLKRLPLVPIGITKTRRRASR